MLKINRRRHDNKPLNGLGPSPHTPALVGALVSRCSKVMQVNAALGEVRQNYAEEAEPIAERAYIVARTMARAEAHRMRMKLEQVVHAALMTKAVKAIPTGIIALFVPARSPIRVGMQYRRYDRITINGWIAGADSDVFDTATTSVLEPVRQDVE